MAHFFCKVRRTSRFGFCIVWGKCVLVDVRFAWCSTGSINVPLVSFIVVGRKEKKKPRIQQHYPHVECNLWLNLCTSSSTKRFLQHERVRRSLRKKFLPKWAWNSLNHNHAIILFDPGNDTDLMFWARKISVLPYFDGLIFPVAQMRAESTAPAALRFLSAFFWVKGYPEPFSQVVRVCRAGLCERRVYSLALGELWLKERQAWVESPGACPGCTIFIPDTLFWLYWKCLWFVRVWWVMALIVKGSGRFVLNCTVTHAARVRKRNLTQESQLALIHVCIFQACVIVSS